MARVISARKAESLVSEDRMHVAWIRKQQRQLFGARSWRILNVLLKELALVTETKGS